MLNCAHIVVVTIGAFATPYDITVVDPTNKRALVYTGLSRRDPTLTLLGFTPGTARHDTATVPFSSTGDVFVGQSATRSFTAAP